MNVADLQLENRLRTLFIEWGEEFKVVQSRLEDVILVVSLPSKDESSVDRTAVSEYCKRQLVKCGEIPPNELTDEMKKIEAYDFFLHGDFLPDQLSPVSLATPEESSKTEEKSEPISANPSCVGEAFGKKDEDPSGPTHENEDTNLSKNQKEHELCVKEFSSMAEKGMPPTQLADIIGYQDVKKLIKQLFVYPKKYTQHFDHKELQHILLYGVSYY